MGSLVNHAKSRRLILAMKGKLELRLALEGPTRVEVAART